MMASDPSASPDAPWLRLATRADVPAIVGLLADDMLGRAREGSPDDPAYAQAFAAIETDPKTQLFVVERDGAVVGCAQLTLIPGLSRRGRTRGLIESVRIAAAHRSGGLGGWLIRELIAIARREGCGVVELTSDRSRADAHRFYERLGFVPSHTGFKLALDP